MFFSNAGAVHGHVANIISAILASTLVGGLDRIYSVVEPAKADEALDETSAPSIDPKGGAAIEAKAFDIEQQRPIVSHAQPASLVTFAVLVLPLHVAAFWVPNFVWPGEMDTSQVPDLFYRICLLLLGVFTLISCMQILMCSYILSKSHLTQELHAAAENVKVNLRKSMIVCAATLVWLPMIQRSRRESEALLRASPPV
ncbi:hypothetical protein AURDEDRAFT_153845 [Auricularia subglabra TFB-10046 SS5]|nr:hypothetical protein AURDEDRAFT_153845 [Auricularia subglabra TFB-10046 SS5]